MKKVYLVFHEFTVDGGFGDAIPCEDFIMAFDNLEDAQTFVERFSKPHAYEKPYDTLYCGELFIRNIDVPTHDEIDFDKVDTEGFWWLYNEVLED